MIAKIENLLPLTVVQYTVLKKGFMIIFRLFLGQSEQCCCCCSTIKSKDAVFRQKERDKLQPNKTVSSFALDSSSAPEKKSIKLRKNGILFRRIAQSKDFHLGTQ